MTTPARDRIGPEQVLSALGIPKEGRVYDLGTDLAMGMPAGPAETFGGFRLTPYRTPRCLVDPEHRGHDFSMELICGSPHLGSHIDAFSHIQSGGLIFGDVPVREAFDDFGWKQHGIETVPPLLTRGLLLDVPRQLGLERLPDGFEIRADHLQECLEADELALAVGDVVLVRTGKMLDYGGDGERYFAAAPGVGVEAAVWLCERGMAALGTDTSATEPVPLADPERTTHRELLVERGVHLLEILNLERLAADRVSEFLFVCLPLRIVGGTGSWVRPVAVV